jgi:diketogulonate reductase-like aldo/keto reductase
MSDIFSTSRRDWIKKIALLGMSTMLPQSGFSNPDQSQITRSVPSTGQRLPVIGMGSFITFNVGNDLQTRNYRVEVLRKFFQLGGQLVDSSPMYGSSEEVLGYCVKKLGSTAAPLFSATKVWTPSTEQGRQQIADSQRLWGVDRLNLNQVHNLVNWQDHLDTLQQMKADGQLQYIGITTSHGRRHRDMENIILSQPIDFVQLTYNIDDREAERRLLPLVLEKGVAVIVNRPFRRGGLFDKYQGHSLPAWAKDFDCHNWAQFFLKYIVSHPAITCAIPATSRVDHMIENMGACYGRLPDSEMRKRMISYIQSL